MIFFGVLVNTIFPRYEWRSVNDTGSASVVFVASIFALLHLPNLWLTIATFLSGLMWAWVYQRVPNLLALALSHAVLTVILVLTVPYSALHGLKVGYGYFL